MNWQSAKTWLIVAFFFLDSLLGWQLYAGHQESLNYTESYTDFLANTKTILADHDFSLATTVPMNNPNLSTFKADMAVVSLANLSSAAFGTDVLQHVYPSVEEVVTTAGTLKIMAAGTWKVQFTPAIFMSKKSENDLSSLLWKTSEYQLDAPQTNTTQVAFVMTYNSMPIFDVDAVFTLDRQSIIGYTQEKITNIHDVGDAKPTITALEALNSLANSIDKPIEHTDNRILGITLGYVQKPADSSAESNTSNQYWFPVWRVVASHQTYYINAFTGEVNLSSQ